MLIINHFVKRFNEHLILEIDHHEFSTGIHWIKGENGSGKTTFFKSISGIIPFDGEVCFSSGIDLRKQPVAFRSLVNYSEAEPAYPGFLTAKDIVRFIGKIKNESVARQDAYIKQLGIDAFFEKPCETYSSGMMKKVALATAFFGQPKLILLDEPLITLDEQARAVLYQLISDKLNQGDITLLLSSHQSIAPDVTITQTLSVQNKKLVTL